MYSSLADPFLIRDCLRTKYLVKEGIYTIRSQIVEDCFTPWLIHDGEFIFIIFKEFIFRSQAFKLLNSSSGDKMKVFRKPIIRTNGSQDTKLYVRF